MTDPQTPELPAEVVRCIEVELAEWATPTCPPLLDAMTRVARAAIRWATSAAATRELELAARISFIASQDTPNTEQAARAQLIARLTEAETRLRAREDAAREAGAAQERARLRATLTAINGLVSQMVPILSPGDAHPNLAALLAMTAVEIDRPSPAQDTPAVPAAPRCDHKFVDSRACLKCGWVPPAPAVPADRAAGEQETCEWTRIGTGWAGWTTQCQPARVPEPMFGARFCRFCGKRLVEARP